MWLEVQSAVASTAFQRPKSCLSRSAFKLTPALKTRLGGFCDFNFALVVILTPLRPITERWKRSCVSEATWSRQQRLGKKHCEIAKSQADRCVCSSAPIERGSELRCAALVSAALRALPTGHRKPFQPASALAPATGRAAREGLPTPTNTFTEDAGGRQRAAHLGAVPGHPRELRGLDQNRDIDDALLRGGLRLAEAEFRQTKGRRVT